MAVLALMARARWRNRARSLIGLALFIAVVGTVVLTAFAGARRTSSALDRLRSATRDSDFTVTRSDDRAFADALAAKLRASGVVAEAARASQAIAIPDGSDQKTNADFFLLFDADGRLGHDVQRPLLVAGRMPNPKSADEVLLSRPAARILGLGVGDRLRASTLSPRDIECFATPGCVFQRPGGPRVDLAVVGIGRSASDTRTTDGGWGFTTPAFARMQAGKLGLFPAITFVRLPDHPQARARFLRELRRLAGPGAQLGVSPASDYVRASQHTLDTLANTLIAFGIVAALAGLVALGQAVNREIALAGAASATLGALGLTRWGRSRVITGALIPSIVLGATMAGVGAFLASPLMPIGFARETDPGSGLVFDVPVVVFGVLALGVLVSAVAGFASWRASAVGAERTARPRRSAISAAATRAGAAPVPLMGARFAFEPIGRSRAPVRSAIVATMLAVTGIAGTAVLVTSIDGLVASPARWGWAWSSRPDLNGAEKKTETGLRADRHVAAAARLARAEIEIGKELGFGYAIHNVKGTINPTIRRGRAPVNDHEIAIGEGTLRALGADIGDTVRATALDGRAKIPLRVVGAAVIPAIDNDDAGTGAFLTPAGLRSIARGETGKDAVLRYSVGMTPANEAKMAKRLDLNFTVYARPSAPSSVQNLDRVTSILVALALFFGFLGIAGVAHGLAVSTRRRAHDLAVLRVLGFRRRQVRSVIAWQATAIVVAGATVGVPLGLIVGRAVWKATVGDLGVLDAASVPWLLLVGLVPVAVGVGLVLAWWPAHAAVRRQPAAALRAE